MRREFPWPAASDRELEQIERLEAAHTGQWLHDQQAKGLDEGAIHLVLALASARYVDHHGPFVGHGTFNGGPMLRAASILPQSWRNLALLQTAAYVVDLLHQPNYGPYLLMEMKPVSEPTIETSRAQLRASIASGTEPLMAEHRLVGLLRMDSPAAVHQLLTEIALRQFHENEHRLLIVHRAAQLMDDTNGWTWVTPLFRAAVQYLGTRPDVRDVEVPAAAVDLTGNPADASRIEAAVEVLIQAEYGDEPRLLQGMADLPRAEVIALAGAEMLRRSRFDAHAVTGIHCVLDLLHDPTVGPELQALAIATALAGQRTRRQKESRLTWREVPLAEPSLSTQDELRDIVANDASGLLAMTVVGGALLAGANPTDVTRTLMEVALTTAGPFEAIHNVKMLWGQLLETQRSRYPELAWRHLAAGARVVAEVAAVDRAGAEPIVAMWHSAGLSSAAET
jgi:hypothetical protein